MTLVMKDRCERYGQELSMRGEAYICTFCAPCAKDMRCTCPNCKGELVPRPRRPEPPSVSR